MKRAFRIAVLLVCILAVHIRAFAWIPLVGPVATLGISAATYGFRAVGLGFVLRNGAAVITAGTALVEASVIVAGRQVVMTAYAVLSQVGTASIAAGAFLSGSWRTQQALAWAAAAGIVIIDGVVMRQGTVAPANGYCVTYTSWGIYSGACGEALAASVYAASGQYNPATFTPQLISSIEGDSSFSYRYTTPAFGVIDIPLAKCSHAAWSGLPECVAAGGGGAPPRPATADDFPKGLSDGQATDLAKTHDLATDKPKTAPPPPVVVGGPYTCASPSGRCIATVDFGPAPAGSPNPTDVTTQPRERDAGEPLPAPVAPGASAPPPLDGPPDQSDCQLNPDRVGCLKVGTPRDQEQIPERNETLSMNPVPWGNEDAQCPADATFNQFGKTITFSYQKVCDGFRYLRPIVIAFAWLTAIGIIIGFRRAD